MSTRYDSLRLDDDAVALTTEIKTKAEALAEVFDRLPGRCGSVALTHLQTAVMYGVRQVSETYGK